MKQMRRKARKSEREWDPAAIADGILTWHMWPGFQGVNCDGCGCEMNVLGMSYWHRCPDCDPDGERHEMHSMHDRGMMPFDEPRFGPTLATIRAGGELADEISESKRGHGRRDYPVETGTEDYLDWAANAAPDRCRRSAPACRWCGDTGMVTLATSTKPCLDCEAGRSRV